jgi:hypothetical protein
MRGDAAAHRRSRVAQVIEVWLESASRFLWAAFHFPEELGLGDQKGSYLGAHIRLRGAWWDGVLHLPTASYRLDRSFGKCERRD